MPTKKLKTKGMHCASCERAIEKAALAVNGVKSARSNFINEELAVDFDESKTNLIEIINAINKKGYECTSQETIQNKKTSDEEYYSIPKANRKYFVIAGTILFLLGLFWIIKYSFS